MSRTRKGRHVPRQQRDARPRRSSAPNSSRKPSKSVKLSAAPSGAIAPGKREAESAPLPSYLRTETAAEWLASLEAIADVRAYKDLSFAMLGLGAGRHVLDLGCGRGDDVRALARWVAPGGAVTGVDANSEMIAAAQQFIDTTPADTAPTDATIAFLVAEGERLPFVDESFDAVRVDRVLQHVERPEMVLREVRRVLRPGGRVVLVEPDWKMMALYPGSVSGGDDDAIVAAILGWQVAHTRHPLIGRQLGALLHEASFEQVQIQPVAYASPSFGVADLVMELSAAGIRAAHDSPPMLSADELQAWIATAREAEARNQFLASLTLFFARGCKAQIRPDLRVPGASASTA